MTPSIEQIMDYAERMSEQEPPYLSHIRRQAHLHLMQPRMLVGPYEGQLLAWLTAVINPYRVLEIGTYCGYSSLCIASGLQREGALVLTIEINDELEELIRQNIASSPFQERVQLHIGDATTLIPKLTEAHTFDLVYIDANKREYVTYYNQLLPKLPSGAVIIADNTLWDGKVIQDPMPQDAQTKGIDDFNRLVASDSRVTSFLLPIRDGLTLIRVK